MAACGDIGDMVVLTAFGALDVPRSECCVAVCDPVIRESLNFTLDALELQLRPLPDGVRGSTASGGVDAVELEAGPLPLVLRRVAVFHLTLTQCLQVKA
jgi:hypothetical protein